MTQSPDIFGIDLGTTNSCIAYVDETGKAVVIPNHEGDQTTPSAVQFDGIDRIVGKEAKKNELLDHDHVVVHVKQEMGQPGMRHTYEGIAYTPEEISSYILRKLAADAEEYLNRPIKDVVITCPAYFGIAQREATVKAGVLAGLNVHEVINEPTAAAILYGLSQQEDQVALVYDLGGGTFDVTVIEIKSGAITVIATGGNNDLGGSKWDMEIIAYLDDEWMAQTGMSDSPSSSEELSAELLAKAEEAEKSLSVRQKTTVSINYAGKKLRIELTRNTFHKLTKNLLQKTIDATISTMNAARERGVDYIDQILLVGGSTRMPQVKERLEAEFSIPVRMFDPDLAVAKGAALYGHKLRLDAEIKQRVAQHVGITADAVEVAQTPRRIKDRVVQQIAVETGQSSSVIEHTADIKVVNVASHSFGIVATDLRRHTQIISNLVVMNEPLPVTNTRIFKTAEEYQEDVEIQVMENSVDDTRVEDINLGEEIGHAILYLPPGLPQYAPIEVTFELQRDGRLQITGREPTSNTSIDVEIKTTRGMSRQEFQRAVHRATKIVVL